MKIWTSSFAQAGRLPDAVSISRGKPGWYDGKTFDLLAPSWIWIKNYQRGVWTWNQYSDAYNGLLAELDAANVVAALGENAVMLCFCDVAKGEKCHRRLVSGWLEREAGIVVPEFTPRTVEQLSLPFLQ
jgi:hypothetical protein